MIDEGVAVALGSDFNPGSSMTFNLPLIMSIACTQMKMTPAEALATVTINAAHACGVAAEVGIIEVGKQADLVVWDASSYRMIAYHYGVNLAATVITLRIGAGAFVCGEETALLRSIEGRRGRPRPRPPYPSEKGLWGMPTLINNVETYANIAPIVNRGSAWFASIGTPKCTGTKVFALAGNIKNTGLIEVPMGIPLRKVIFDIGGGTTEGTEFKAAQTGGPSGGCIPKEYLDLPVDYESLTKVGSIMGSGGMIVMDSTSNMVDVAKYFMEFCKDESCGKCVPCRVGTVHIHGLLDKISKGHATTDDLALLEELCVMVKETSLCGLGQSAPNPVLSTLRYFRTEFERLLSAPAVYVPSGDGNETNTHA